MKKVVCKLDLPDDKAKQKAMKAVSAVSGIDSISFDMKSKTITIVGAVDPVAVVGKLRKSWPTHIFTVGPAKEPEQKKEEPKKEEAKKEEPKEEPKKEETKEEPKKEEPKKEEPKKEEPKKEEAKKEEPKKEEEKKKEPTQNEQIAELVKAYKAYNPQMTTYYYAHSMEENPNACVIC